MLNQRLNAARQVNDQLHATERAIDAAVMEAAAFVASMPRARMEANIAAEVGQAAIERSAAAFAALIEARREIVAAHQELAAVKDLMGLRTVALGGMHNKGPKAHGLSVVENAA